MTGTAFKVVVIYPEAKRISRVYRYGAYKRLSVKNSNIYELIPSLFSDWIGHAFASLLVWVRLLTQSLLTPRLKPHSVNMQPVGQKKSDSQKCWLPQPRKTCGQDFSLCCTTQWRWHAKWQQHLQQSLLKTFWNRQVFFQLKHSWAKLNTPWLNKSKTGIYFWD